LVLNSDIDDDDNDNDDDVDELNRKALFAEQGLVKQHLSDLAWAKAQALEPAKEVAAAKEAAAMVSLSSQEVAAKTVAAVEAAVPVASSQLSPSSASRAAAADEASEYVRMRIATDAFVSEGHLEAFTEARSESEARVESEFERRRAAQDLLDLKAGDDAGGLWSDSRRDDFRRLHSRSDDDAGSLDRGFEPALPGLSRVFD
jgi:hypothetical protein